MDLWSNDPEERLKAARDPATVGDLARRMGATAPMQPWPYGMATSVNPFVVFLGPSPGNSPIAGDLGYATRKPNDLPTAGVPYPGIYYADPKHYFERVRQLGETLIQARAPRMTGPQSHALLGQLNLGTGAFGQAAEAGLEPEYCRWVPDVLLDYLRPAYVILLGLTTHLSGRSAKLFDPSHRLAIDWKRPDDEFRFEAYTASNYRYRIWTRTRPDGKAISLVLWPQHPSRAPMTNVAYWQESGREFATKFRT